METEEEDEEEILFLKGVVLEEYGEEKEQVGTYDMGEGSRPSAPSGPKKKEEGEVRTRE
jgi:hypothetical protein